MITPPSHPATDRLAAIEDALHSLVGAEVERRLSGSQPTRVQAMAFTWTDPRLLPNRARTRLTEFVRDPVAAALQEAMIVLGCEVLASARGDVGTLHRVLDRVAERDKVHAGRRHAILDAAWARVLHHYRPIVGSQGGASA
jgi:hypothetical protein